MRLRVVADDVGYCPCRDAGVREAALVTHASVLVTGPPAPLEGWPAELDEIRFYRSALSAAEILQIYDAGVVGMCLAP